jgi:hypothetical protein
MGDTLRWLIDAAIHHFGEQKPASPDKSKQIPTTGSESK